MQSMIVVRMSDMKPVLECWASELSGRTPKPGFHAYTVKEWLTGFNLAVKDAGGGQPTAAQIRQYL